MADRIAQGPLRLARGISGAWSSFWFQDVSGAALGAVRVLFGLTLLLTLAEFAPLLAEHYTGSGYFPISAARQWSWGNLIALFHVESLDTLPAVVAIYTLLLFVTTLLTLGWHTRVAATAVFGLLLWFQTRNPTYLNGGDEVLRLTSFYLFLAYLVVPAAERTLSVDRWRATQPQSGVSPYPHQVTSERLLGGRMRVWPVRMLQIQICILYAVAGAWKLAGDSWWTADAVFYATQNPQTARFIVPVGPWTQPFFLVASLSVAVWEVAFPALYLWRRTRKWALAFGVCLHVGILLTMNIGFFSFAVLAVYPALWGAAPTQSWLQRQLRRLLRLEAELPSQHVSGEVAAVEA